MKLPRQRIRVCSAVLSLALPLPMFAASPLLSVRADPPYIDHPATVTVGADGQTITIEWPQAMSLGSGWSGSNLNIDGTDSGDDVFPSFVGNGGTNTATWTMELTGATVLASGTPNIDIDGFDAVVPSGGGNPMLPLIDGTIDNQSTQGTDPAAPYLVHETFNTASGMGPGGLGYDLAFVESGTGTIDEDQSTGAHDGECLQIISAASNDRAYIDFAAQSEQYGVVWFKWDSLAGTTDIVALGEGNSRRLILRVSGAGMLSVIHGSAASPDVADAIPSSTWVAIRYRYDIGTGMDGHGATEWSATGTFAGSGTKYSEVNTGTATSTVDRLHLGANATETHTVNFDDAKLSKAGFAGYPEP